VVAPAGTVVWMVVAVQLPEVTVAVVPLNFNVLEPWDDPNPVPVIVTAVPEVPEVGLKLVILGAATTVNDLPLLATPPTVTTTFPVDAPVGTVVTIEVAVQFPEVTVAVVAPNLMVLVPWGDPKFVPVTVTVAPIAPVEIDKLVMPGAAEYAGDDISNATRHTTSRHTDRISCIDTPGPFGSKRPVVLSTVRNLYLWVTLMSRLNRVLYELFL
jgi:hypothetical protein